MNKFLIGGAAAAAILAGGGAVAQTAAPQPGAPAMQMHQRHMAGPMTRATVASHVQAMFARADANRDGFITKAEAEAVKQQMHGRMAERRAGTKRPDRAGVFDLIDANKDGMISREEFAARPQRAKMARHAGMRGMGGKMFDRADANNDGRVSLAEAQQAALARFDRADANRDGTISREERMQVRQLRQQRKAA